MARAETGMRETRHASRWLWRIGGEATLFLGGMLETITQASGGGRPGAYWLISVVGVIVLAAIVLPSIAISGLASD